MLWTQIQDNLVCTSMNLNGHTTETSAHPNILRQCSQEPMYNVVQDANQHTSKNRNLVRMFHSATNNNILWSIETKYLEIILSEISHTDKKIWQVFHMQNQIDFWCCCLCSPLYFLSQLLWLCVSFSALQSFLALAPNNTYFLQV